MSDQIRNMFSRISKRYDLANTLLSLGQHYRWRKIAVRFADIPKGAKVLDLACGTGDFAIAFAREIGTEGSVIATDFSDEMLRHAKEKIAGYNISLEAADAMSLRFNDNLFDAVAIAFGIRNIDDPVIALREMKRVVKAEGKIVVIEFGQPSGFFGMVYTWYSNAVIPFLGGIITGERNAYRYLQTSSAAFPCGDEFIAIMKSAGIERVSVRKLLFGVVWIYLGKK